MVLSMVLRGSEAALIQPASTASMKISAQAPTMSWVEVTAAAPTWPIQRTLGRA